MPDSLFCEIRVKGHLAQHWCDWLGGLAIENQPNGEALLSGSLADQAALHGVLRQIRDLGLALVSLCCDSTQQRESKEQGQGR